MCHQGLVILGFILLQYLRHHMLTHPTSRPTQQEETKVGRFASNVEMTLFRYNHQVCKSVWHQHGIGTRLYIENFSMQAGCVFTDIDNKKDTSCIANKDSRSSPHHGTQNPNHQQATLELSTFK